MPENDVEYSSDDDDYDEIIDEEYDSDISGSEADE